MLFHAAVVDDQGSSYAAAFRVLPNFQVLPEEVYSAYRNYDEKTKKDVMAKYNVLWDGVLKQGEIRKIEIISREGPYLRAGSRMHVEITWTDDKKNSAVVKTPAEYIRRTD